MSGFKTKAIRYIKQVGGGSLLISLIVHLCIIGGATFYVIQKVTPPPKANFASGGASGAPSVQHAVKMSNTQPKLETLNQRLSVDTPNAAIALPDLPMGNSTLGGPTLSGGLGGSGSSGGNGGNGNGAGPSLRGPLMPAFGFKEAPKGGTLVGHFYDLKQFRSKKANPNLAKLGAGDLAAHEVGDFIKGGWNSSSLAEFFQAPNALYATQIFVPVMIADAAPKAYGVEKQVQPRAWVAHYKGKISPPQSGAFRLVGAGDDFMAVRVDGRLVLDCGGRKVTEFKTDRPKSPAYKYDYPQGKWMREMRGGFTVGNRMELRAGQFYDIDIVFSEGPGGSFCAMLLFEQEGVDYKKDGRGNPILPIFRVADSKTALAGAGGPAFDPDGPLWRALPASR